MAKPTLKSLQGEIDTLRQLRQGDSFNTRSHLAQIDKQSVLLKANEETIQRLTREVQWHKQLSQNLSEAICAHMRNR